MSKIDILSEINNGPTFAGLISEFGLSTVYFVEMPERPDAENPYDGIARVPECLGEINGGRVHQVSDRQRKDLFGETDAKFVRLYIEKPLFDLNLSHYAIINYFDKTKIVMGTVASINPMLNQRIEVYVETASNVPFTLEQAGIRL
jgi:hypothetical protein